MQHFAQKSDTMFVQKTYGKPRSVMVRYGCRQERATDRKEQVSGQTDSRKRREWNLEK